VPLGGNIQTVGLGATQVAAGSKATVAGWGGVHFGGQTVSQLRHVTLDVISNPVCAAKYVGSAPAGELRFYFKMCFMNARGIFQLLLTKELIVYELI